MPTIGYGEDALTYLALHAGRAGLLKKLQDETPPDECLVYFRPSFGRSGGPYSPQFGEFDGILRTQTCVYLIESKWNSVDRAQEIIILLDVQRLRHLIFTWLYENWCDVSENKCDLTWAEFVRARGQAFTEAFPHRPLAPDGSLLARNLYSILSEITQPRRSVRNLLLYFHPERVRGGAARNAYGRTGSGT